MLLRLKVLRFQFAAARPFTFPEIAANKLRGALGKTLWNRSDEAYARVFSPKRPSGPSGLSDPPRPFVLRASHLDGLAVHDTFEFALHLFDLDTESLVMEAVQRFPFASLHNTAQEIVELSPEPVPASRAHVRFITPMELKADGGLAPEPEFGILAARIRDRVSTLRALYGAGPLAIDFADFGRRAAQVRMNRCEIRRVDSSRRSANTGQTHPLGGFVGEAGYTGDLSEFIPYLRAAQWTGVGRQTTWGKGQIELRDPVL